jgi:glycosyltransferase involved in cell wall biosynthesis
VRVAYLTPYDPSDRTAWSGLGNAMMRSLQSAGCEIVPLGPLENRTRLLGRMLNRWHRLTSGRFYANERSLMFALDVARQAEKRLRTTNSDVLLAAGSVFTPRLSAPMPMALWADATFASFIEHYGISSAMSKTSIEAGHKREREAYQRSSLVIFASEWAASSARRDYGVPDEKILVAPFGANFLRCPDREDVVASISTRASSGSCELLSVGVDWQRKGMDKAVSVVAALRESGVDARITIVGCRPPPDVSLPAFVKLIPFIDKNTSEGEKRLISLYLKSHFHILLSTAECFGITYCEANACGVPNIASDLGGIPTAVVNGRGGWRFAPDASAATIAGRIAAIINDKESWKEACLRARREYEDRLNWEASGRLVKKRLQDLLVKPRGVGALQAGALS